MSFVARAQDARQHQRMITGVGDPWAIPSNGSLAQYSSAGVPVDETSIMSLLSVTACVRVISDAVSSLPLDAVKNDADRRTTMEPPPLVISDPFGGANVFNGFGITRFDGLNQMMVSLLLRGNAYVNIAGRDKSTGMPNILQVLNPDAVAVDVDNKTGERLYKVNRNPFPSSNMVHVKGLSLPGQPQGLSVLSYAKRTIGLGIAAEEFGSMFFGNGAHMSGIIEVPGDLKSDVARTVKETFESKHAGMRHAHAVGVLTGGAQYHPISVSPEDAQFIATRAMQTADIAMLFGVPPHMLGQTDRTTSWGKGIEEQTLGFLKFTLMAWLIRIENAFSAMLFDPWYAKFNLNALQRADTTTRYSAYAAARNAAIMTPNEIRALEDLPPVDGGDDLFAALNSAHNAQPGDEPKDPDGHPIALLAPSGTKPGAPQPSHSDEESEQ